jgi:flagellar biosynthesis/type III secretory pathway M-ring protein FliF/YscJ
MADYQSPTRNFSDLTISERTSIKLQLGFIGAIVAAIISAVLVFASMRADVIAMISRVSVQEEIIKELQKENINFKVHQQSVDDNLMYLRQVIEEDQVWHRTHQN